MGICARLSFFYNLNALTALLVPTLLSGTLGNYLFIDSVRSLPSLLKVLSYQMTLPNSQLLIIIGAILISTWFLEKRYSLYVIFIVIIFPDFSLNLDLFLIKDSNNLLSNSINLIHPCILLLIWALLSFYLFRFRHYSIRYSPYSGNNFSLPLYNYFFNKNSTTTYIGLLLTLVLGMWWALQLSTWGGFWEWDRSEILLLVLIFAITFRTHARFQMRNFSIFYFHTVICFLGVYFYYIYEIFFFKNLHSFFPETAIPLYLFNLPLPTLGVLGLIINLYLWIKYVYNLETKEPGLRLYPPFSYLKSLSLIVSVLVLSEILSTTPVSFNITYKTLLFVVLSSFLLLNTNYRGVGFKWHCALVYFVFLNFWMNLVFFVETGDWYRKEVSFLSLSSVRYSLNSLALIGQVMGIPGSGTEIPSAFNFAYGNFTTILPFIYFCEGTLFVLSGDISFFKSNQSLMLTPLSL